jgi:hypothetical protein
MNNFKKDWERGVSSNMSIISLPYPNSEDDKFYETVFYSSKFKKYYRGHQVRLGNYFRQLYQSVSFANENMLISYDDKYSYIKILRGQLSAYEQSLLFINSISVLGRVWELDWNNNEFKEANKILITKYNLIKNILTDKVNDKISLSQFYPEIEYELFSTKEVKIKREGLKNKFWDKKEEILSKAKQKKK